VCRQQYIAHHLLGIAGKLAALIVSGKPAQIIGTQR
jgi:hypothetical protein